MVVVDHHVDQFGGRYIVGFKAQRIDRHLEHLVTTTGDPCLENGFEGFEAVLKIVGDLGHRAFGDIAAQVDDDDRKFREIDLVDRVFFKARRKLGLGRVHCISHVGDCLGFIPAEIELEEDAGIVFLCQRIHVVEPIEIGKLGFHGFDEKGFSVRCRDAGEGHRDK